MALYHMDIKAHSRTYHIHAIALSSYRSGERLLCDADGKIRNCRSGNKSAVEFTSLINNRDLDRERLWNKVEKMERRKDAVVAREMELALPCELSIEEQKALSLEMGKKIASRYNCAVDLALHAPDLEGDSRNWHVHLLFSPRSWADADKNNREFSSRKYRDLNKANAKEEVLYWRSLWEGMVNASLEKSGKEERVSSLSCEARGKLKKYKHIEFNKYQFLRRSNELESAKKASRLELEINRDEMQLEDLMELRVELLKEKEQLLLQLQQKKEKSYAEYRREAGSDRAGQYDDSKTESGYSETTGETQTGTGSPESGRGSQRAVFAISGDHDGGLGEVETSSGSEGNREDGRDGSKAWGRIREQALKLWQFLFKNELWQRLNPFKKRSKTIQVMNERTSFKGLERSASQKLIEGVYGSEINRSELSRSFKYFMAHVKDPTKRKQYQEIANRFESKIRKNEDYSLERCLLKLLDIEAQKLVLEQKLQRPEWERKWSESELAEIKNVIKEAEESLRESFLEFRGHKVKKDYRSIIVAREEVRGFFGKVQSYRDVIIGFQKSASFDNLREAAKGSAIDKVVSLAGEDGQVVFESGNSFLQEDLKFKSGWRVYKISLEVDENLEEVLREKCASFEVDDNLIKREAQVWNSWQASTEEYISNLKVEGIRKFDLGQSGNKPDQNDQDQSRGMKI